MPRSAKDRIGSCKYDLRFIALIAFTGASMCIQLRAFFCTAMIELDGPGRTMERTDGRVNAQRRISRTSVKLLIAVEFQA